MTIWDIFIVNLLQAAFALETIADLERDTVSVCAALTATAVLNLSGFYSNTTHIL